MSISIIDDVISNTNVVKNSQPKNLKILKRIDGPLMFSTNRTFEFFARVNTGINILHNGKNLKLAYHNMTITVSVEKMSRNGFVFDNIVLDSCEYTVSDLMCYMQEWNSGYNAILSLESFLELAVIAIYQTIISNDDIFYIHSSESDFSIGLTMFDKTVTLNKNVLINKPEIMGYANSKKYVEAYRIKTSKVIGA